MENEAKDPLPHHKQQELCTSRLPYRQGRKLTAVKAYTINSESNHLLIFGVPSINLRQETKSLFMRFGKITKFSLNKDYKCEQFTETYHAVYKNIKFARIVKKMLDTKNFYGSSLHVCYAPELETVEETSTKLFQRRQDVLKRLKNLQKELMVEKQQISHENTKNSEVNQDLEVNKKMTLNMGNQNIIYLNKKRKLKPDNASASKKKSKVHNDNESKNNFNSNKIVLNNLKPTKVNKDSHNHNEIHHNNYHKTKDCNNESKNNDNIDIIDFTSTEKETITNINEALNYNKFGNEIIKKVENKPLNVIKFNFNKKI